MTNETILVVDADTKSQKVLEISFKKAGYRVIITESVDEARRQLAAAAPDLIVCDTQFPGSAGAAEDGFSFCKSLQSDSTHRAIPFIFLTEQSSLPEKMYGLEVGADEYLTKPIYIKEVTHRVEILLQKRAQARLSGGEVEEFRGDLADVTMIDLLQTIEQEQRSGSLQIARGARRGAVYFSDGNILDAVCGKLRGEDALYRLMLWPDGEIRVQYHAVAGQTDHISKDSSALLLEGIRRLDQWNELVATLPPLGRVYEADYQRLPDLLANLPEEVSRLVRLFDGIRSLREIVNDSPFNDITTLQIMQRLLLEQMLREVESSADAPADPAQTRSNLEAWLAGGDERGDIRRPFSPVDPAADSAPRGDDPAAKPAGGGETGGHWTVRWDESAQDASASELDELQRREARRREEEAKHLIRESGRFRATLPLVAAVDRDEDAASRRTTTPIESVERVEEPPITPRKRRQTPIAAPNAGGDSSADRAPADQTSPGIQIARLFTDHDEENIQDEIDHGVDQIADARPKTRPESPDDETEFADHAPPAERDADVEAIADADSDAMADANANANADAMADADADAAQDRQAPDEPNLERRAAAVDEAAAVTREASKSMRDSAPLPSISRYEEAEDDAAEDDDIFPVVDHVSGRQRRITDEISSVGDDEVTEPELVDPVDLEVSRKGSEPDPTPDERPVEDELAEEPAEAGADTPAQDDAPAQDDDAPSGASQRDTDGTPTVPNKAISPADASETIKIERTAVDRRMVFVEYDLGSPPASDEPAAESTAADEAMPLDAQASQPAEDATDELPRNADISADDTPETDDTPEAATRLSRDTEELHSVEDGEQDQPAEEVETLELERTVDAPEKDSAEVSSEDSAEDSAGDAASADEISDAENPGAEPPVEASTEPSASAVIEEQGQESSFFASGEEGTYDWEFEDVPKSTNRWKYFTAIAIIAGATMLLITVYVVTTDNGAKEAPASVEAGESAGGETEQIAQNASPEAEAKAAEPAEKLAEVAAVGAPGSGLDPAQATEVAGQDATRVRDTAQGAARLLAGVDLGAVDAAAEPAEAQGTTTPEQNPQPGPLAANDEGSTDAAPTRNPAPADPVAQANPAEKQPPEPTATGFDARLAAAESQVKAGQNSQALSALRKLSAEKAGSAKAAYLHGVAALGAGNFSESAKQLSRADRLGYNKAEMYLDLASAYQLGGDVSKAKGAYEKFLAKQPTGKRADEVRSILERL